MFVTFSTHTRQSCGAVVGYCAPQRSFFLPFEHEFVRFARVSPGGKFCWRAGKVDDEDLRVQGVCGENGETFLTEEQKRHSPFVSSSLAFRKHSQNHLRGAAQLPQSHQHQERAVPWHRKLLRTAQMPAPEMWNVL